MIWIVKAVQYISPVHYNFAALADNEWGDDEDNKVAKFLALNKVYEKALIIMLCLILMFHLVAVSMLKLTVSRFQ